MHTKRCAHSRLKLLACNNGPSQVELSLSPDRTIANIAFEYLDQGHGFVIELIHEGTSSNDLFLKGSIKGAPSIAKIEPDPLLNLPAKARKTELLMRWLVVVAFLVGSIFLMAFATRSVTFLGKLVVLAGGAFFFLVSMLGLFKTWTLWRYHSPNGLEPFYEKV